MRHLKTENFRKDNVDEIFTVCPAKYRNWHTEDRIIAPFYEYAFWTTDSFL